jgi:glyoxylase-like metal-dependent hydrolase (beta-lactamase superfamily II)
MAFVVATVVVPPFMVNSYVAGDEESGEAVVVDPGGEIDRLARALDDRKLHPVAIVLTHGHIDHVAGAAEAKRRFAVPLLMHEADRFWIGALSMQAAMFGLPLPQPFEPDRTVADGEELPLGPGRLKVIHTPGHTPGGISLFCPEARSLFTGDTLFAQSIGRTDLPGGDLTALLRSIRERLFVLGDEVAFYPGHGPGGTLGQERRENPFVGDRADGS